MADNKKFDLSPGFEEIPLDTELSPGFEAIPSVKPPTTIPQLLEKKAAGVTETISEQIPGAIQTGKDIAKAVAEEALLGGGAEAYGALAATGEKLKSYLAGQPGRDWLEIYRQSQQAAEKELEEAKERTPIGYRVGQVAGTILPALLTAGAGLGAKAAARVTLPALEKAIATKTISSLGKAATTSAALGATEATLRSKGELETSQGRQKILADAIGGALMGGAVGTAFAAAAPKLRDIYDSARQSVSSYIADSPKLRQSVLAFKQGKAGTPVTEGLRDTIRIGQQQTKDIADVTNRILDAESAVGSKISNTIKRATDEGVQIGVTPDMLKAARDANRFFKQNPHFLKTDDAARLRTMFQKIQTNTMTPLEANQWKKELVELAGRTNTPEIESIANNFYGATRKALTDQIPDLNPLYSQFYDLRKAVSETIVSRGLPVELSEVWMGDMIKGRRKLTEGVRDLLTSATTPGAKKLPAAGGSFPQLITNLNEFDVKHPGVLKEIGLDSKEFFEDIISKGDEFAIAKQKLGFEPQAGIGRELKAIPIGGATTGKGRLLSVATVAGQGVRAIKPVAGKVANLSRKLYDAPAQQLGELSKDLYESGVPGLVSLGKALEKGLADKNTAAKNAALFAILQNPKSRLFISGEEVEEETPIENGEVPSYGQ